jgi:3-oxoacyl-[acyl-carrier protein] reductase
MDDERAILDLNFHSARRAAELFGARMRVIGSGRILLVSSIAAWRGSRCEPYARSKAALLRFQREQCAELARSGVTLNVLLPGPVDGPFLRMTCDSQRRAQYLRDIPMGRFATADDVAALAVFLVSRQAGYITGAAVPVSGGLIEALL